MGAIFQLRALAAVPLVKGPSVSVKLKARWDLEKKKIFCLCLGYTTVCVCVWGGGRDLWSHLNGNTEVSDLVQTKYRVEWLETET